MDPFPPTEQQRKVIEHREGNLLVFAGPGTGKTETLARRFASLVAGGLAPSRILVLTFSHRAADEMRDRVLVRVHQVNDAPMAVSELFVKTFHSFCGRLLEGDDRTQPDNLLTPVKERLLWRSVFRSRSLALDSFDPSAIESSQFATDCLNVIAHLKGQGISATRLAELAAGDQRLIDVAKIFAAMEAERMRLGLRDFRDLVNEAVGALQDPMGDASQWLRRCAFEHVLVDEFQDSDRMQLCLLEMLRSRLDPAPLFCFVGDVNQSIYRFRGAAPENIKTARTVFDCATLELRDNRRSVQAILDVANSDPTLDQASLTLAADCDKRGSVRLARPRTTDDEVRTICNGIVAAISAGTPARSIAVLLRQTRPYQELIIDELTQAGVPVAALPAAGFHEDSLVDAVLTALRLLATPDDERLWRRLLSNPIVGFHPIDLRSAFDAARRAGVHDPIAALRINPPRGVRAADDFIRAWRRCSDAHAASAPFELLETIARELDLLRPVRETVRVPGFDTTASPLRLDALLRAAQDYTGHSVFEFITHLDETVGLLADARQPPPSGSDGVRVMSIHAAKGLEFDFVIVPQLIDGVLPASERPNRLLSPRSVRRLSHAGISVFSSDEEILREEHSLWYVALTRARTDVLATAACVDDEGVDVQLSPFARAIVDQELPLAQLTIDTAERLSDGPPSAAGPPPAVPIRLALDSISPTGVNNFIRCPRRFFYQNVLHLPVRDDDATEYGLVLHEVLRRFHEIEADFRDVRDPVAAASRYTDVLREILAEETAGASVGVGPLASFEREDLERRFSVYARSLAAEAVHEPFRVLACERDVVSPFAGVAVRGRVDRVDELSSGGLVVRDYKSGRTHGDLTGALRKAFERIDAGVSIFGDAPEGLNLQAILYVPGVERTFAQRVRRLDYLYFRGKSLDDDRLYVDSTWLATAEAADARALSPAEVARVERDIAARIVTLCSGGELLAFPTSHDVAVCRHCSFTRICPGPGAVA